MRQEGTEDRKQGTERNGGEKEIFADNPNAPTLSICIVNWNTREFLLAALQSVYDHPPAFAFEVVVTDNASADGSVAAAAASFPQAVLIANSENAGYARGNNQALEQAGGKYKLLLNPDVVVPPGTLETAVAFMEAHADAGALGVRQAHPDGRLQPSVRGFPAPLAVFWELLGLSRLLPKSRIFGAYRMTWFDYAQTLEVDQPMGTFLLIRARVLKEVGLLDEAFPIFFNEVDWCLRCKRAGWKIYFTPDAQITHYGGASTAQVGAAMAWESRAGLLNFYRKHYRAVWLWPLRLLIAGASWPHAWLTARKRRAR